MERDVLGVNNWYQNNVRQSDVYGPKRTNQFVAGNANPRLTSEIASRNKQWKKSPIYYTHSIHTLRFEF